MREEWGKGREGLKQDEEEGREEERERDRDVFHLPVHSPMVVIIMFYVGSDQS